MGPVCGDGVIQFDTEDCDGPDLGGATCDSVLGGAYEGTLGCDACQFDTNLCKRRSGMREGPVMATVPRTNGSGTFQIDSTEVTRAQYEYFLQHVPSGFGLPPFCNFQGATVSDFTPDPACLASAPLDGAGPGARNRSPIVCVDFCDALAFCQWAGKSLCGGTTMFPPNAPWDMLGDSNVNAWTAACTANGSATYPYGSTYQVGTCNDDGIGLQEVGTRGSCHSPKAGYDMLRDMSGNVSEWNDACQGGMGANDLCAVRGGDFAAAPDALKCASSDFRPRATQEGSLGFRCCEVTGMPPPL